MKIIVISAAYHPALGGAERTAQNIAEGLAKNGHDVTVLTADVMNALAFYTVDSSSTARSTEETLNGVAVRRLKLYQKYELAIYRNVKHINSRLAKVLSYIIKAKSRLRFYRSLDSAIRMVAPDAILTLPHLQPSVKMAIHIATRRKIWIAAFPLVHSHDPYFPVIKMKGVLSKVNAVIAITQYERTILIEDFHVDAGKVVYSGLGANYVTNNPVSSAENSEIIDILFLGRKTKDKGLNLLVDAAKIITNTSNNVRFVLVGALSHDSELLVSKFRSFLTEKQFVDQSNVSDEEVWSWLSRCRVLVFPSRIESFGSVILEAWSARKPVITLDVPIFREIVDNGIDGILVPDGRPDLLAAAIFKMINDREIAEKMGEAGFLKVSRYYDWKDVIKRIESVLPSII